MFRWSDIIIPLSHQIREGETSTLMEVYNEVCQADLEGESSYNLTEANMVKVGLCVSGWWFPGRGRESRYSKLACSSLPPSHVALSCFGCAR